MNMNEIVALPSSFDLNFDLIWRHRNVCVDIYRGASATLAYLSRQERQCNAPYLYAHPITMQTGS